MQYYHQEGSSYPSTDSQYNAPNERTSEYNNGGGYFQHPVTMQQQQPNTGYGYRWNTGNRYHQRRMMTPVMPDEELSSMLDNYFESGGKSQPSPGPNQVMTPRPDYYSAGSNYSHHPSPGQQSVDSGYGDLGGHPLPSPAASLSSGSTGTPIYNKMSSAHSVTYDNHNPTGSGPYYVGGGHTSHFNPQQQPPSSDYEMAPSSNYHAHHSEASPAPSSSTSASSPAAAHVTSEDSPLAAATDANHESSDQDLSVIVDQVLDSIDAQFSPPPPVSSSAAPTCTRVTSQTTGEIDGQRGQCENQERLCHQCASLCSNSGDECGNCGANVEAVVMPDEGQGVVETEEDSANTATETESEGDKTPEKQR